MSGSPTLERVLRGELCSGCGMCASIGGDAIEMRRVPPGYNRPHQIAPIAAAAEMAIAASCPGAVASPWPDTPPPDPYWGSALSVMTGYATDASVRFSASSGGALSALLIAALESGMVDAVLHVSADPDAPAANQTRLSRSAAEIMEGAGSRYAPSSPLADIESVLAGTERVAFVGKPCDVSALRELARIDPRVNERVPIILSFFCGGIPSHSGTDAILAQLGVSHDELASFRYRGDGWPGFATAIRRDGSAERMSYMDSWGRHLSRTVQFRCKICPDAVGGVADIACADAWYGDERGYPLFEEQDGRSLIMVRTAVGQALLDVALGRQAIVVTPLDISEIGKMQPAQAKRRRLIVARLAAMKLAGRPSYRIRGMRLFQVARKAGIGEMARSFAGMLRRLPKRRQLRRRA